MANLGVTLLLAGFLLCVLGLVKSFPISTVRKRTKTIRNAVLGGAFLVVIGCALMPEEPPVVAVHSTGLRSPAPAEVASTFPSQQALTPVQVAAIDFHRMVRLRVNACDDASAGAYLTGSNLSSGVDVVDKYLADSLDAVNTCKNAFTILGSLAVPVDFAGAARKSASDLVLRCQRYLYRNMQANQVAANALESGAPMQNAQTYLQMQHEAETAGTDCIHGSERLGSATGADLSNPFPTS